MISISHMKTLSKSKPADVWCLDSLGEHSIRFDRSSLCSQIKAIPIEEVIAMLTELKSEIEEIKPLEPTDDEDYMHGCFHGLELMQDKCLRIIQQRINALRGEENDGKNNT